MNSRADHGLDQTFQEHFGEGTCYDKSSAPANSTQGRWEWTKKKRGRMKDLKAITNNESYHLGALPFK